VPADVDPAVHVGEAGIAVSDEQQKPEGDKWYTAKETVAKAQTELGKVLKGKLLPDMILQDKLFQEWLERYSDLTYIRTGSGLKDE
jgi:hypothetical protein